MTMAKATQICFETSEAFRTGQTGPSDANLKSRLLSTTAFRGHTKQT